MPARKPAPTPRKASGANIEEWQRSGTKVQFRLDEWETGELERRAASYGLSTNAYAARVLRKDLGPKPPVMSTFDAMLEARSKRVPEYDNNDD